jgi:hypothetical protein
MRRTMLTLAALAAFAAPAFAQTGGYTPPREEVNCNEWTRKLETGLEVIAPGPNKRLEAARAALQKAKSEQAAGKYYACAVAADSGIRALDAG